MYAESRGTSREHGGHAPMQVEEVLEKGIADGTQIGAQIYVSRHGSPIVDIALGDARPGVPMVTDSLMVWFSMTKAVTSVAVAQQWERGALDPDDLVVRFIPEFGAQGKDGITLRHLLTHTAGIPNVDAILQGQPWRESRADNLARIYAAPIEPGWVPGKKAGYHAAAGMSRARRDRRAHERPAVRRIRARGDLRAARDARLLGRDARGSLRGVRRPHRSDAQHRRRRTASGCAGSTRRAPPRRRCPARTVEDPCASSDASTRCCSVAARSTVCNCSRPKRSPRSPRGTGWRWSTRRSGS